MVVKKYIDIENLRQFLNNIKTKLNPHAFAIYTGSDTNVSVTSICGDFPTELKVGARITIKNEGSVTTIKTLNVNNTGAKNVYYKGSSLSSGSFAKYCIYEFVFDGNYWRILGIDTNTHYTAKNIITDSSTSSSNSSATNGNVHLNIIENSTIRSSHKIIGTGATEVSSDSDGNIIINSTNGNTVENHDSSDNNIILSPNILHVWDVIETLDIQLGEAVEGKLNEYMFQFTSGDVPTSLTILDNISWVGGSPTIEPNKIYQCSIINNIGVIVGV